MADLLKELLELEAKATPGPCTYKETTGGQFGYKTLRGIYTGLELVLRLVTTTPGGVKAAERIGRFVPLARNHIRPIIEALLLAEKALDSERQAHEVYFHDDADRRAAERGAKRLRNKALAAIAALRNSGEEQQ